MQTTTVPCPDCEGEGMVKVTRSITFNSPGSDNPFTEGSIEKMTCLRCGGTGELGLNEAMKGATDG